MELPRDGKAGRASDKRVRGKLFAYLRTSHPCPQASSFDLWSMIKTLTLLSMALGLIAAAGVAHADPMLEAPMAFEGAFGKLQALKAMYGELTDLTGRCGVWSDVTVPEPLARYFTSVPKGRACIAFDAPFEVKGIEKHVIVTATVPADEPYECHQCAPLIGGAVFERVGNQWVMEAEDKYIAVTGEFGTIENDDISLARIASNEYGVLFRGNSVHQGYVSTYVSLIVPYGQSLVEALQFYVEGPGDGACPDAIRKQEIKLVFTPAQGRAGHYDIEANISYNSGKCGHVKAVKEKRYYTFASGKYKRVR